VYTASGTFVGMRGGDRYAVLVRKTEPKPIRIFMQDGSHDGMDGSLGEVGDWWMGNQAVERALEFAGYQVRYVWGEGPHGSRQGTTVFPDAMRWLWKDWPQPVTSGASQNVFLQAILLPGEGWQPVAGEYQSDGVLASEPNGAIVFHDAAARKTREITPNNELADYRNISNSYTALAFGPSGRVYVSQAGNLFAYSSGSQRSTIATGIQAQDLVVTHDSKLYLTESGKSDGEGKVWVIQPKGRKTQLDGGLNHPSGIAISPDGLWLAVAENKTHWGYSYRLQADATVEARQPFYWFHVPDTADDSGARSWVMDREGRLYAATRMGVQVFDRNGRVRAILPVLGGEAAGLAYGGESLDTLYVSCADGKLYRRKLKVHGSPSWSKPIQLPTWSPG
jgi:sugar lactone lactonase YvrE